MARNIMPLTNANNTRNRQVAQVQRDVESMYSDLSTWLESELSKIRLLDKKSPRLANAYLKRVLNKLDERLDDIEERVQELVLNAMEKTAQAVVKDNESFLDGIGAMIADKLKGLPKLVVTGLLLGTLYKRLFGIKNFNIGHSLLVSKRRTKKDIKKIVASNKKEGRNSTETAEDLTVYLNPKSDKSKEWSKRNSGVRKKVAGAVITLVVTLVTHTYLITLVEACKYNDYIIGFVWDAAGVNSCPLCQDRDGNFYKVLEVPLEHPNGMCILEPVLLDSVSRET